MKKTMRAECSICGAVYWTDEGHVCTESDFATAIKDIKTLLRDIAKLDSANFTSEAEALEFCRRAAKENLFDLEKKFPQLFHAGLRS